MESAIRLCYSPLPSPPLRQYFHGTNHGSSNARTSKFHLKFNPSTLCLSHFSIRPHVIRSFGHANCTLNRFSLPDSENEGSSDNKILRGVTAVSLALACVVGLFNVSSKLNPKFNTAYAANLRPFSSTSSTSSIHKGDNIPKLPEAEDALETLWQMINADHSELSTCPKIDGEPDDRTIGALKVYAVRLSKSGKKSEARKLLEDAYNKHKQKSTGFNLGMACVELLMFQGSFEEARDLLHRLLIDQNFPSDDVKKLLEQYKISKTDYDKFSIAQILLYKAIIHTMLKNKEAAKWWEAFLTTQNENENE